MTILTEIAADARPMALGLARLAGLADGRQAGIQFRAAAAESGFDVAHEYQRAALARDGLVAADLLGQESFEAYIAAWPEGFQEGLDDTRGAPA